MDNFMDKLAKRFNAGEMIKANAQAEARDMKRLQEQTAQYEKMMQEMRRLNLKNVEVTEQVQQLIQCGIEQFEGYGSADGVIEKKIDDSQLSSMNAIAALESKLSEIKAELKDELAKGADDKTVTMEIANKLDSLGRDLLDELRRNQMELTNAIRSMEDKLNSQNGFDAAISRLETSMASERYATEDAIRGVKDEVLESKTLLVNMQSAVDEGQKRLEDHVHRENVRVYRNVQAAIIEETQKRGREMSTRLDTLEKTVKKTNGIKPLVILTFLFALLSLAIQVMQMLNLMPF